MIKFVTYSKHANGNKTIPIHFQDRQLLIYIRDLFSAGEDTSSATLRWSLVYLLNYPDAQKKIHEEIEATFGKTY